MTTSDPTITLAEAFEAVELPLGAAQSLLQWMGQQIGHDTEAGRILSQAGAELTEPTPDPPVRSSTTTTSKSS